MTTMRRTLNVKLLAGLLVAIALLGGGVHLVHGFQEKRNAGDLLRKADQAERKGDLEQDEKYLSRYLAFRPDDDDALARYALLLDKRNTSGKNRVRVLLALEESLRRADNPDDALRRNVRRRIAELAMTPELGRYRDAEENLRSLLKSSPDDGELEQLLGQCFEAEGQTGKHSDAEARYQLARTWYEKAIAHAPNHIDAYTRLSGLLRGRFRDPAEANRTMDRMIAGDPRVSRPQRVQAQAHLARARYRTENHLPGVDEDVREAQELAPDEADVLVAAVESARSKDDQDGARKLAERGIELHPKDMRMYQILAAVESQSGQPQEA